MLFIILGLALFYHFLATESLSFSQCIILILVFFIYVAVIYFQQVGDSNEKDAKKDNENETENNAINNRTSIEMTAGEVSAFKQKNLTQIDFKRFPSRI